jgi:hypothetical protein
MPGLARCARAYSPPPLDPGITYANVSLNYEAGQLNLPTARRPRPQGTYNVWAMENIFFYVPQFKIVGAKFAPMVAFPTMATGSLAFPFLGNVSPP